MPTPKEIASDLPARHLSNSDRDSLDALVKAQEPTTNELCNGVASKDCVLKQMATSVVDQAVDASHKRCAHAPKKCKCPQLIAALTDPSVVAAVLNQLGSNEDSHDSRTLLENHLKNCLHVDNEQCPASRTTAPWVDAAIEQNSCSSCQQVTPQLRLTIQLPMIDLLQWAGRSVIATGDHPSPHLGTRYVKAASVDHGQILYRNNVPVRSVVYEGNDGGPGVVRRVQSHQREDGMKPQRPKSYLASMDSTDLLPEGNINWKKVEDLERLIWSDETGKDASAFVRQGSLLSYVKILKKAIEHCKRHAEELSERANGYYERQSPTISAEQLQKLAHFRLMMLDVRQEIQFLENRISTTDWHEVDQPNVEKSDKRLPLTTPTRMRERYARQIRVVTEMLAVMKEMLDDVLQEEAGEKLKLV